MDGLLVGLADDDRVDDRRAFGPRAFGAGERGAQITVVA
jgi:hypothetical protein